MFDSLTHPLDDIANVTIVFVGIVFAFSYVWTQIRKGKSEADSSTIQTYQAEVEALKIRVTRFEQDNKALTAQVNKLIGENQTLKEINSLRDPSFVSSIKSILNEIKQIREDFQAHALLDDKRFNEILVAVTKEE